MDSIKSLTEECELKLVSNIESVFTNLQFELHKRTASIPIDLVYLYKLFFMLFKVHKRSRIRLQMTVLLSE